MLSIRGLGKTYPGGVRALDQVNLEIGPGMFGLLGPNGAGKSTLMKILATLLVPDEGEVTFEGVNLVRGAASDPRVGRLPAPGLRLLSLLHRDPDARLLRRAARPPRRRARRARVDELLAAGEPGRGAQAEARRLLGRHAPAARDRAGAPRPAAAPDRGRAHRRPRSRGAAPLPQSPRRREPGHRGHPLDAHRERRGGPLLADGGDRSRAHRGRHHPRRSGGPPRRQGVRRHGGRGRRGAGGGERAGAGPDGRRRQSRCGSRSTRSPAIPETPSGRRAACSRTRTSAWSAKPEAGHERRHRRSDRPTTGVTGDAGTARAPGSGRWPPPRSGSGSGGSPSGSWSRSTSSSRCFYFTRFVNVSAGEDSLTQSVKLARNSAYSLACMLGISPSSSCTSRPRCAWTRCCAIGGSDSCRSSSPLPSSG